MCVFYAAMISTSVYIYVQKLRVVCHCNIFLLVVLDVPVPLLDPHRVCSPALTAGDSTSSSLAFSTSAATSLLV